MRTIDREIQELLTSYDEDCKDIADLCVEEGYPSHGSNYELRCESLWNSFYAEEYADLTALAERGC